MKAEHANGTPTRSAFIWLSPTRDRFTYQLSPFSHLRHESDATARPRPLLRVRREVAHLLQGKDDEGSSAAGVDDDGDEFGVDGAEGAVPRDPGDADVIVALVVSHRLAENVTELALSHDSPHHICGAGGEK